MIDWKEIAVVIKHVAMTGEGSEECLEAGCLPMPLDSEDFHSPIPNIRDLQRRGIWKKTTELPGVAMQSYSQIAFAKMLGERFSSECVWPVDPPSDPRLFYTKNGSFSHACASSAHYMVRHFRPRLLIEVGSGMSSRVLSAALDLNEKQGAPRCRYRIIDPFPSDPIRTLPQVTDIVASRVEESDLRIFSELTRGDILFIDSTHTVKTGGDVNFLILEVLPRLNPGVVIHFHDISLPVEYDEVYFTKKEFRKFWTEQYLLQAFLAFNAEFEVLLGMAYLAVVHPEDYRTAFPNSLPSSGSIWIRRKDHGWR